MDCYSLGLSYQDDFKANEFYKKACDGGYAEGCNSLGIAYLFGMGVRQDDLKANEFYGKANVLLKKTCDNGVAMDCYSLGVAYITGGGVKQDDLKAKELYGKACDGGVAEACREYAILNKR